MVLRVYQNTECGTECCPACGAEFCAPFSLAVCRSCGFISFGCNMCPLDYGRQTNRNLKATCEGRGCPVYHPVHNLYAIFSRQELASLPKAYCGEITCDKASYMHVLLRDRVEAIYSERAVVGITTIDMHEWRRGNTNLRSTPKLYEITGDELLG